MATERTEAHKLRNVKASTKDLKAAEVTGNKLERLPCEITTRILSYLDASALVSISHTSKFFYQLASDNALWVKIYVASLREKKKLNLNEVKMKVPDRPVGYWRRLYFDNVVNCDMRKWKRLLGHVSCHTGLPSRTEEILRNSGISWELTVTLKSGEERALELSWSQFWKTSLTLCWNGGVHLPSHEEISTLQLHGVRRIELHRPDLKKLCRRSLMAELDIQASPKRTQVIGQDKLVRLNLLGPGIAIALWQGQSSVAFVMFTLHFHMLLERSTQGSPVCLYVYPIIKPPFDDIDPEYGLHGYQIHIAVHNSTCELLSKSFSQLFCHKDQICNGFIELTAIDRTNLTQHAVLSGDISLHWRCEGLQGTVQNCCVMSVTVLDEFKKPFKCICSPVSMELEKTPFCYSYGGEHFLIHFKEPDIQVKMQLAYSKDQNNFILIGLGVLLSVCEINKHFGRNY